MNSDVHVLFTKSYFLYVKGVRRSFHTRLESRLGDAWWERGVEFSLPEEQVYDIHTQLQRHPSRDRLQLLDTAHFARIISKHHNEVFSDAFPDAQRVVNQMRSLTVLRNDWAHVNEISLARVVQAAEVMKNILASLRCEEALEIEAMIQGFVVDRGSELAEDPMATLDSDDSRLELQYPTHTTWSLWDRLQSYLVLEQSVDLPEGSSDGKARITVRVHNIAPDSRDLPTVHFRSVVIHAVGGAKHEVHDVAPGDTREVEFEFPVKQLVDVGFEVAGEIDSARLFQFNRTSRLPAEIVIPLQKEFAAQLESIAVRAFVDGILEEIGAHVATMTLASIASLRESLRQQSGRMEEKRSSLTKLSRDFSLGRSSRLGSRTMEIIVALGEFKKKLDSLDEAIGRTDIELINEAVHDLKQIQVGVLRVEDTIQTMTLGE